MEFGGNFLGRTRTDPPRNPWQASPFSGRDLCQIHSGRILPCLKKLSEQNSGISYFDTAGCLQILENWSYLFEMISQSGNRIIVALLAWTPWHETNASILRHEFFLYSCGCEYRCKMLGKYLLNSIFLNLRDCEDRPLMYSRNKEFPMFFSLHVLVFVPGSSITQISLRYRSRTGGWVSHLKSAC